MNKNKILPFESEFFIGCNYWASHAGTAMWSNWQESIVDEDLQQMAQEGIEVIRVFPLWPDFQPIDMLYGVEGQERGYRFGEERFLDNEAEKAGVSEEMMGRFVKFTELAEKHGIKLIVGLITGWMSGRLFVPPALRGRSILTDPRSIQWQVRFIKYFIKKMKYSNAIIAWDLGNECNCMGTVNTREEAWLWTCTLSNAIKSSDPVRPLISGMHSLSPNGKWTMQDQGELTDILTTHPYPLWTPHVGVDPINTIRPIVHATAESLYYADLGGKPCFAEEIGTMGPMISSEQIAGDFARASLFSLWAHGCHGMVWWCAYDQTKLNAAPYDWVAVEGELGLITEDRRVKPVLKEMNRLNQVIKNLPFEELPPRNIDAVCILNTNQDHWAVALGAFTLSKQSGFDLEFQLEDQPLKESDVYILPSVSGFDGIPKQRWNDLLDRVYKGAALFITLADGFLLDFEQLTGLSVQTRSHRRGSETLTILGDPQTFELELNNPIKLSLKSIGAEILGTESDGNICFSKSKYGEGTVFLLTYPIEKYAVESKESLYYPEQYPYWKIYREVYSHFEHKRVVKVDCQDIGITEHPINELERIVILVNYSPEDKKIPLHMVDGWHINATYYGEIVELPDGQQISELPANEAVIISVSS
ncbi:cellulase family glycosylhydrolase [Paenibacillus shunpengii]|uniref:Cellulase family glycosylhydrolase n=1 Tax=Paenibacillus shunpengii TaxID=2054424 RepID=A0ABW5SPJ0_9BACL